jgi:radical SAM protein with 4Fe4S-binding SPASM domain
MTHAARVSLPTDCSIVTTYRCQMRCEMCNIWHHPTEKAREIGADELAILPKLKVINITGGEPFVRKDLDEIAEVALQKAELVVVSTSGWHAERILEFCRRFPRVGIRVSIEGLAQSNDRLRGRAGGFDRALKLLLALKEMRHENIGFGMTVSNHNSEDLVPLYRLAKNLGFEFATASFHNSFYFHKTDNVITERERVIENFYQLADEQLRERSAKSWFRALFNLGLVRYIRGMPRMLPCEAGLANFFVFPYGDVYPCNGLEDRYWRKRLGNIREARSFEEIWYGPAAEEVRRLVATCPKNCWMVGTAAPVMKKYLKRGVGVWVAKAKLRSLAGRPTCRDAALLPFFDVGQSPLQGDLAERKGPTDLEAEAAAPAGFVGDFEEDDALVRSSGGC